ncbi:MAG: Mor transcription activator family protein [Burkholderiaceae bacterium]
MGRKGSSKTAEMVSRLVDLGTRTLTKRCAMSEAMAREAMREIAHDLCRDYGGQYVYVPKDQELDLTQRDLDVYNDLTSGNANEVAKKHNISVQQVYAINRYVRDKLQRERQHGLPGFDDAIQV